ncbi:MAG: 2-succinyl-6-hydroxy-2,4-cyclohexadiene-1-carboxylate synthase [Deltaproteobacteria bacterium]|nr:MAG: 2-succinyl-6-hydroxy-2,4-cyclohexadiene-1-carboxylate synthase [Deltaproteobacteria bacterium]
MSRNDRHDWPPVLALHGFSGSGEDFEPLRDALAGEGGGPGIFAAPDLPGHGDAPVLPDVAPGEEAFVAAGDTILAQAERAGLHRPLLLGYSMGGRMALHLALRAPQRFRALVLVGATPGIADPAAREAREDEDRQRAAALVADGIQAFADRWEQHPMIASQDRIAEPWRSAMRARRRRQDPRGLAWSLAALGTGVMPPLWDRLAGLTIPVLLLTGEEDAKFTAIAEQMACLLPAATHGVLPGAGHCAHLEQPARAAAALREFVGQLNRKI